MTDLDKLIAAVDAGLPSPTNWRNFAGLTGETADGEPFSILAHRAYHGSLDAAKRLHDAMLPGWRWNLWAVGGATVWEDVENVYVSDGPDPARAWLLAILRAFKAKGE